MEAQANLTADVLAGRLALPGMEAMRQSIALDDAARRRQFAPRFGFIWDRLAYCRALESGSRQAARRPGSVAVRAASTAQTGQKGATRVTGVNWDGIPRHAGGALA
jgi:hypothetical protein